MHQRWVCLLIVAGVMVACDGGRATDEFFSSDVDAGSLDASEAHDGGSDGGLDSGVVTEDAGSQDSGPEPTIDAGMPDAGSADAGIDAGYGSPCQRDTECSPLAVCLVQSGSGTCVAPCTSDGQCTFGTRCAAALDSGRKHCLAYCSNDASCPANARCISGLCQTRTANGAQYCQSDSGCSATETCQGQACAPTPATICEDCASRTCGDGLICTPLLTSQRLCFPLCPNGDECPNGWGCYWEILTSHWECEPDDIGLCL